ncbi:MAG: rod shape-determining protein RodA, partial [Bdellovibrionales bacterium]|nr:rod shape-determining protein RodA [Bdellovibrionales bacterium]
MKSALQVEERTFTKRLDLSFAIVILGLNLIGLINLYSATHGVHDQGTNRLFINQIVWLIAGWGFFFVITLINYDFFGRLAYLLYALNVGALAAVMFVGRRILGAQRWLDLGFFHYQPSETMKLTLILVLARYLSRKNVQEGLGYKDLIVPGLLVIVPFGLTVKQPDLGTAMLLVFIAMSMIMFVRVKRSILAACLVLGLVAAPMVWNFGLKPYQKNRILTFVYPGRDPRGAGYNSIQSKIAVGSGKILGKGFRKGTQSQLEFLPERHTDFIYSVLSEEHGFIGSLLTLGLFMVLLVMGIRIASQGRDKFGALVVVGVLAYIFWHMFINIG